MLTIPQINACRYDLLEFTKVTFKAIKGIEFVENWHHRTITNTLTRVVLGECKRLIINIPPRYGKTELAVVNFIAWCMGKYPDSEFIHLSYGARLAGANLSKVKKVVESEIFKEIFPEFALSKECRGKTDFESTKGGKVYGDGTGGSVTGLGCGKLADGFHGAMIIDDPIKPDEASSELVRTSVNENYMSTVDSRMNNPKETPVIVIMQRLHEEDMSGFLLNGGSGEEWEHLVIPAWDEKEVPLWPLRDDHANLMRKKLADAYTFAGQMEQRPAPRGGGIFKDSYWRYYRDLPVFKQRMIFADTALKTGEQNDFSVLQLWGQALNGAIYLIDQSRGKWEAPQLEQEIKDFYNQHREGYATLSHIYVEDKASGIGAIQSLSQQGLPIIGVPRDKDKELRANCVTGLMESGNVFIPENAPWIREYKAEFALFPRGKHDDQIDPTIDAIETFLRNEYIDPYDM